MWTPFNVNLRCNLKHFERVLILNLNVSKLVIVLLKLSCMVGFDTLCGWVMDQRMLMEKSAELKRKRSEKMRARRKEHFQDQTRMRNLAGEGENNFSSEMQNELVCQSIPRLCLFSKALEFLRHIRPQKWENFRQTKQKAENEFGSL